MKLSFSLPPKSKSTAKPILHRNAATSAAGETNVKDFFTEFDPSKTQTTTKQKHVIPPLEDRRRSQNHPIQSSSAIEFEPNTLSNGNLVSDNITYGLNLRQKSDFSNIDSRSKEPVEQLLLKSLREDMKSLPDAPKLVDFESVPVDGYGAALLAGYGWKPGQGIGLKAKEDVKIVEYSKWNGNEGFGFSKKSLVEKEKKKKKPCPVISHEVVKVGINVEKDRVVSKRSRETDVVRSCKKSFRETKEKKVFSWLRSDIRVRIISKNVEGGRLYLKKAVVNDVVGTTSCDITMDETEELVRGVDQEVLETALPRRGGYVLVLYGRHKGVYGRLVEKDLDKETGVVCDADSREMIDVKLEQVAEYVGDLGDIGY
ncbi:unnamed protein product [Cochlearia groenlandica]